MSSIRYTDFFFFLIYLKIYRTVTYVQRRIYGLFRWKKRFLFCTVSACVVIKDGVCVRYLNELCVCVCVRENKKSFNVRIIRFTTESTLRVRILLFIRKNSIRKRLHTFVINRINFFFLLYITFVEYTRVFTRTQTRSRSDIILRCFQRAKTFSNRYLMAIKSWTFLEFPICRVSTLWLILSYRIIRYGFFLLQEFQ